MQSKRLGGASGAGEIQEQMSRGGIFLAFCQTIKRSQTMAKASLKKKIKLLRQV
jgi:hypothetical protein